MHFQSVVILFLAMSTFGQAQSILKNKETKTGQTLFKVKDSNTRWMDSIEMCNHLSDDQFEQLSFDDSLSLAVDVEALENIRMAYLLADLRKDHQFALFETTFGPVDVWFYKEDYTGDIENNLSAGVGAWKYEFNEKKLRIKVKSLERSIETQKAYVTNLLIFLNQKNSTAKRLKFGEFDRSTMGSLFFDVVFDADMASSTERKKMRDEFPDVETELLDKVTFAQADYHPDEFPQELLPLAQPYIDKIAELQKQLEAAKQAYQRFQQDFSIDYFRSLAVDAIRGKEKQFYCPQRYAFFLRVISPEIYARCFEGAVDEICSRRASEPYIYCHNQSICEASTKVYFDRDKNTLKIIRTKNEFVEGSPFSVLLNHPELIARLPFSQQIFILKSLRESELALRKGGVIPSIDELHSQLQQEYELIEQKRVRLRLLVSQVRAKQHKLLQKICPVVPKKFTFEEMKAWTNRTEIGWEDMCSLILEEAVDVLHALDPYRLSIAARFKDAVDRTHWLENVGEKDVVLRAFDEISNKERELESQLHIEESRLYTNNARKKIIRDVSSTIFENLSLNHNYGAYPIFFLTLNYPKSYTKLKTEIRNQLALHAEARNKAASLSAYLNKEVFQLNIKNPTKDELIQLKSHFSKIENLSKELILEVLKAYTTSFSSIETLDESYRVRSLNLAKELQVQAEYDLGSDMFGYVSTAGRYLRSQNILQLDIKSLLINSDARRFLETILHETFHIFQEIYFTNEQYSKASPWMKDMTDLFEISALKYPKDDKVAHDTHPLEVLVVQSQMLWVDAIVKP